MNIREISKDSQTRCLNCSHDATWTIEINHTYMSLCDACCDELSVVLGDAGQLAQIMTQLKSIIAKWDNR